MPSDPIVRLRTGKDVVELPITLDGAGPEAAAAFEKLRGAAGVHLLLTGDRPYAVTLRGPATAETLARLQAAKGASLLAIFPPRRAVRRRLAELLAPSTAPSAAPALDLTEGRPGAAPL